MPTMIDNVLAEAWKLWRPPARTARGRAVAVTRARRRLIRAQTRLVEARTDLERARGPVEAARLTVDRRRRELSIATADARRPS